MPVHRPEPSYQHRRQPMDTAPHTTPRTLLTVEAAAGQIDDAPFVGDVPEIDPNKATYTVLEVAYLINLSLDLTDQYVEDGTIPAFQIGRRWVISRKRFAEWIDSLPEAGGAL